MIVQFNPRGLITTVQLLKQRHPLGGLALSVSVISAKALLANLGNFLINFNHEISVSRFIDYSGLAYRPLNNLIEKTFWELFLSKHTPWCRKYYSAFNIDFQVIKETF